LHGEGEANILVSPKGHPERRRAESLCSTNFGERKGRVSQPKRPIDSRGLRKGKDPHGGVRIPLITGERLLTSGAHKLHRKKKKLKGGKWERHPF